MTNAELKDANEIKNLLNDHTTLQDHLTHELAVAKTGEMPNMMHILNQACLLNVIKGKDMVPVLENYTKLAQKARQELQEEFNSL